MSTGAHDYRNDSDVWIRRIAAISAILSPLLVTAFGFWNVTRSGTVKETVDQKTEQVLQGQEKAKKVQEETAEELKARLQKQLAELEAQELARGSQLYTNWKYLEDIGETTKAAEAKKLYDEFRARRKKMGAKD